MKTALRDIRAKARPPSVFAVRGLKQSIPTVNITGAPFFYPLQEPIQLGYSTSMEDSLERQYIRHPSDIPIQWRLGDLAAPGSEYLRNISEGGLAFISQHDIPVGALIDIHIPIRHPEVSIRGYVVWCKPYGVSEFEVGVRFTDADTRFRMRMVEQVCHIEHFKKEIFEREGRELTGEQAAMEWIKRYAKDFPR